jgi:predicted RNase H-like nuclease (RuvC/YqgF family)
MNQQRELQQQTRLAQQAISSSSEFESQGDSLLERANAEQAEQAALLNAPSVDSQYAAALASQIESKHGQVERIEDRLESLIEQQSSRLQQSRSQQPGIISLPSTKAKWQQQLQQQQSTMQRLQGRLEVVREIKDGMGVHGPVIEELAAKKLRREDPGLAGDWDDQQTTIRSHQALQRKKEADQRQQHAKSLGPTQSLTLSVSTKM